MVKIAICDDEIEICHQLEALVQKIVVSKRQNVVIEVFYSAKKLFEYIQQGNQFDAIFMDIEMDEMTGIEFSKKLREEINDEMTKVIFISWEKEYALDLFAVRPFHFLIKPLEYDKIKKVMEDLLKIIENENLSFAYKVGNEINLIDMRDIIYFMSDNRKIIMVTTTGKISFYGKLSEILSRVGNDKFWYIHQSYIINYDNVKKFEPTQVTMVNDRVLPISQSKRKETREKQKRFITNGESYD